MKDFTPLNNFFDHVYVITLRRAIERQQEIVKNLQGLAYEFFIGMDNHDYSIEDMIKNGIYNEALAKKNHRYHKTFKGGQVCCAWSHRNVYADVIEKGYQKVLILEDDVTAKDEIGTLAIPVLSELSSGWELLYFDYNKNEKRDVIKQYWYHVQSAFGGLTWNHTTIQNLYPKQVSPHLYTSGYHDYTSAYAITASAARKLLQLQTPIIYLADNLLATACTTKLVNGYISRPKLFSQLSQGSEKITHSFVDE